MGAPAVSVVLPIHNRAELLAGSAGSVLAQDFSDLELIVVDDASTQDIEAATRAIGDPRVRYVRRPRNGGPAAARNTGIAEARAELVAFQDSDDRWLPGKLARQVASLRNAPRGCPLVIAGIRRYANGLVRDVSATAGAATPRYLGFSDLVQLWFGYPQVWLARREALLAVDGFDERLWVQEDYEALLRLARRGPVLALPDCVATSLKQTDSLTAASPDWVHAIDLILTKHEAHLGDHSEAEAALRYFRARQLCLDGRGREGRADAWRALRLAPRRPRAWMVFGASFLPTAASRRIITKAAARRMSAADAAPTASP